MQDLALIDAVASQLEAAMVASGWDFVVLQKEQPTNQGQPTEGTVYFEKLFDYEYGFPSSQTTFNQVDDDYDESESQQVETTIQISTVVTQNPSDTTLPTSADVANYCKLYMNSRHVIRIFATLGINVLRVTSVRNPYNQDDRQRSQAYPNFDLVVVHNRGISFKVDAIKSIKEKFVGPVIP